MRDIAINKVVKELLNLHQFYGFKMSFPKSFYDLTDQEQGEAVRRWKAAIDLHKHPPWRETK
jgi:hypothetical protein